MIIVPFTHCTCRIILSRPPKGPPTPPAPVIPDTLAHQPRVIWIEPGGGQEARVLVHQVILQLGLCGSTTTGACQQLQSLGKVTEAIVPELCIKKELDEREQEQCAVVGVHWLLGHGKGD